MSVAVLDFPLSFIDVSVLQGVRCSTAIGHWAQLEARLSSDIISRFDLCLLLT